MSPTDRLRRRPIWGGSPSSLLLLALAGLLALASAPTTSHAQRERGTVTFGLQVGRPGGATGKLYRSPSRAYDGLFTTNGTDAATLYLHPLWERPLPDTLLHAYAGPGVVVGGRRLQSTPVLAAGLSAKVGLNFFLKRFEVFLEATPYVQLRPRRSTRLGGSVGLRYRFR